MQQQYNTTIQERKFRMDQVLELRSLSIVLVIVILFLIPMISMAQASGGQVRRPVKKTTDQQT